MKDKRIITRSKKGEVWQPIQGYENYFISNHGRVYSILKKKLLKQELVRGYYYRVKITTSHKYVHFRVHRLVASAFIPNPDNKPIVHHKDGNAKNNKADNLQWVTRQEHNRIHNEMRKTKGDNK